MNEHTNQAEVLDPDRQAVLRGLSEQLGVKISNYHLLDYALTHASSLAETKEAQARDYESLEFLGDAVLGLAVAHYLFETLPERTPGEYSKLRASVVNRNSVARVGRELGIASLIKLGKGEEGGGGRKRLALLADSLEAIIGAVYLDAGWESARLLTLRLFGNELDTVCVAPPVWDYKSMLQQYCQAEYIGLPRFDVVLCKGPDHRKHFEIEVIVRGQPCGRGEGSSKKEAEQQAARQALLALNALDQ